MRKKGKRRRINKGNVLERVGGMEEKKGEESETSTGVHKERETD